MATQIRLDKKIDKKISLKMLEEFDKISINPLVRAIMEKYINKDFDLSAKKITERFKYKPEQIQRKNLYISSELLKEFDVMIKKETNIDSSEKRTATLEVCFLKWLNEDYDITKDEFDKYYVR